MCRSMEAATVAKTVLNNSRTLIEVSGQINPENAETLILQGLCGEARRLPKPAGARQQADDYSRDAAIRQ